MALESLRRPLSIRISRVERAHGNALHLRSAKLPTRIMPTEHRPVKLEHHGSIRSGRSAG